VDVLEQLRSALSTRYRIDREIGRGGMATVYLARDIRHERQVALKVLNPELGAVVGTERFLAEIRVTANLQHPNLLPLFDSGEADGQLYYVMPYVEGESLRARILREKQLPIAEAVHIAMSVASALDYAHRHNVIHRDLKPENILLHEGQPVVADFGIALAVSNAGGNRVTQTGISLGTPQYMSPEQATGDRVIDGRADIYSLGAVLYEMLAGDPPHTGSTAHAVIAKVLTDRPRALHLARDTVPKQVEAAVECALAKLPADRFATAQEFVDALRGTRPVTIPGGWSTPASVSTDPAVRSARRRALIRAVLPWTVAAVALVAAALPFLRTRVDAAPRKYVLTFPDSGRLRMPTGRTITISPDGSRIAYTGGQEGGGAIYIRELGDLAVKAVRGTERGQNPTFSPDGRTLLFAVDGRLKRVPVEGGTPVTVADSGNQGFWAKDGTILFSRNGAIFRTTAVGGAARLVARPDTTKLMRNFIWPRMLPGGDAALVTILYDSAVSHLGAVRMNGEIVDLGVQAADPTYVATGHLIFGRMGGAVLAAPFDARRLRVTGGEVPVLENVIVKPGSVMDLSVADDGTMIHRLGLVARTLVLVDEAGRPVKTFGDPQNYQWPRISPDGKRIAVTIAGTNNLSSFSTWMLDGQTGVFTRLAENAERPEWTPDGRNILSVRTATGFRDVAIQPWDGSAPPSKYLMLPRQILEVSMPRGGRGFFAVRIGAGVQRDIFVAPVDSPTALRPLVNTPADEYQASVSADGKWLAYVSDESGRTEVYVRAMPGPGGRVQISTSGGLEPAWSPLGGGHTVFYRDGQSFVAADITWTAGEASVNRHALFSDIYTSGSPSRANYAVAPDGKHFLVLKSSDADARLILTEHWFEELRRRMGTRP